MIHHISLGSKNYSSFVQFYLQTLKELKKDIREVEGVYPEVIVDNKVVFNGTRFNNLIDMETGSCLNLIDLKYGIRDPLSPENFGLPGFHICFSAKTEEDVRNWYNKALELGAKDNGAPGIRPHYGKYYYGAFVIDPEGYRLEACIKDYIGDNNLKF